MEACRHPDLTAESSSGSRVHILPDYWPCHMEAGGSQLCSQALFPQAVFLVSLPVSYASGVLRLPASM